MSGIFSCFTRPPATPPKITEAFQSAVDKATEKGRVSTSVVNNLLKAVTNSTDKLTLRESDTIKNSSRKLANVLINQNSNKFEQKSDKILQAYDQAELKLSPEAKTQRAEAKAQRAEAEATIAIKNSEEQLAKLEIRANDLNTALVNIKETINSTIASLPTDILKDKATEVINNSRFHSFNKDTSLTKSLLKATETKVDNKFDGKSKYMREHKSLSAWTSLEGLGYKMAAIKENLHNTNASIIKLNASLNQSVSVNLNQAGDNTGTRC